MNNWASRVKVSGQPDRSQWVLLWAARLGNAAVFFAAATLCFSFLSTSISGLLFFAIVGVATLLHEFAGIDWRHRGMWMRWPARMADAALHLFFAYLAVAWTYSLGWTVPGWLWGVVILLSLSAFISHRAVSTRIRIPAALPIGVLIAACMVGWRREEGLARCDDYRRVRQQPGVAVMFPPVDHLATCDQGESIPIRRFPRKIWESPHGERYVLTTTAPYNTNSEVELPAGNYDGLFCEVSADGSGRPHCVGGIRGKAHQVDDAEQLNQLLACAWGLSDPDGSFSYGAIYRLSRDSPLTVLEEHRLQEASPVFGFYQPSTDEYHFLTDECGAVRSLRGSDFSPLPDWPVANCAGAVVYDPKRDEGILCGGVGGPFAAFAVNPWQYRPLALEGNPAGRLWLSWGCDLDWATRKVYATVPNLGLLVVMDYDSGRVERAHFVGFALRAVAFDASRQRVYLADFLGGNVRAFDAITGQEIMRWFVGRFVREVHISRDGKQLLSTSTLGVVRINLDSSTTS